jgi:hypothetical protein
MLRSPSSTNLPIESMQFKSKSHQALLKKFFKDELILKFIWKNKWFKTEEL